MIFQNGIEFISKDLDRDLINAGYSVDRISNYTSKSIDRIDEKTLDFIKKTHLMLFLFILQRVQKIYLIS